MVLESSPVRSQSEDGMMKEAYAVIDADIHPVVDSKRVLDFLPNPWRTRYESGNKGPGGLGYWNPVGVMRSDAVTSEGKRIEANGCVP